MSRIVIISGTEGEHRIDYSTLAPIEIDKRIKAYQRQYGSFRKFFHAYDCESSPPEDSVTLVDWESLLAERKVRKQSMGRLATGTRKRRQGTK
jgi:hypothetical protein